jgi:hypothetical protein
MSSGSGSTRLIAEVEGGASLSSETWKMGWMLLDGGSSSLYATALILETILNGPKYLKQSF